MAPYPGMAHMAAGELVAAADKDAVLAEFASLKAAIAEADEAEDPPDLGLHVGPVAPEPLPGLRPGLHEADPEEDAFGFGIGLDP